MNDESIVRKIKKASKQPVSQRRYRLVVLSLSAFLITFGFTSLFNSHAEKIEKTQNPDVAPPTPGEVITSTIDEPDETPVDPEMEYIVPPDQPRRIILPTIGTEGFIEQVGVTEENIVAAPSNTHFAGWYIGKPKPGDAGVSLIDGHVHGQYNAGIFYFLPDLASGDRFSVEYGDGSLREFEVESVTSYSLDEIDSQLFQPKYGITNQLNLITCGGDDYEERVLVVSRFVG